jgi:Glucose / Sorbosone dehydrogenase
LKGVIRAAGTVAAFFALLWAGSAHALTLQPVGSFDQPTYVTSHPGDDGRLLVVERKGPIRLVEDGTISKFADLSSAVGCAATCAGERGLMSIALDPDFEANGRLYAVYGSELDEAIHVDELVASGPDRASATLARALLEIPHSESGIHYGGQLQFGPDGLLYLSTGDGGGSNDQFRHAQDPADPLGKILRIDPDSAAVPPYTIWSYGLRNPFRFSFDALTGDMVIGDVGQALREEIDLAPSTAPGVVGGGGANYGWSCREGFLVGPGTGADPECVTPAGGGFVEPVFDYPHTPDPDLGGSARCSVIGGYVARDPAMGALYGRYVYTDLCSGVLRSLQLPSQADGRAGGDCSLGLRLKRPVSFGEDAAARLYVVEQGGGVYRLSGPPPLSCPFQAVPTVEYETAQPKPTFVGIKAQRRRVERGKAALLTVWVSPCTGRKGETVKLLRNGRRNGTKSLSRACTARFLPRVRRATTFRAVTTEERGFLPGISRKMRIKLAPRRR